MFTKNKNWLNSKYSIQGKLLLKSKRLRGRLGNQEIVAYTKIINSEKLRKTENLPFDYESNNFL